MSGLKAAHTHLIARKAGKPGARERSGNRAVAGAGYTIAHAGRQIRLGPVAFWIFVGTVVIMAGWSVATATYFAFRDDLLKGLIARQAEQQYAYEDRIAELRAAHRPHHQPSTARPGTIRTKARRSVAPAGNAGVARGGAGRHRRSDDDRLTQVNR